MSENPRYKAAKSIAQALQVLAAVLIGMGLWAHYHVLASVSVGKPVEFPNLLWVFWPQTVAIPWQPTLPILGTVGMMAVLAYQFWQDPSVITEVWMSEKADQEEGSK